MNISQEYLKKGQEVVDSAIALDKKGFIADAIRTYMKALEWFEMAAKHEPNHITRSRIQEKMGDYARRVETLKASEELVAMPKNHVPKYLQEAKPLKRPCKVCNTAITLGELVICDVCNHVTCRKCIHLCELCGQEVCSNDLDREVAGNVCFIHASPKEVQESKKRSVQSISIIDNNQLALVNKQEPVELVKEVQPELAKQPIVAVEPKTVVEKIESERVDKEDDEETKSNDCIICFENIKGPSAIVPCGHIGFCYTCVTPVKICPICRVPVTQILKLYG